MRPIRRVPRRSITGDLLAGDTDEDGTGSLTIVAGTFGTNDGGSVTIEADGDFTFWPKAATSCTDHSDFFDYTVTDQNSTKPPGTPATDVGRVTIEIQDCVWYVDSSLGAAGDGTSSTPYNALTAINAAGGVGDVDTTGERIFLYDGTYTGGLPLEASQLLFGQRHGLSVPDGGAGSVILETAGGRNSQVNGGVVLASGNTIQGIHFGTTGSSSVFALSGSSVGDAVVDTVTSGAIDNPAGGAININGSGTGMNISLTSVTSSGSSTNAISFNEARGTFTSSGGTLSNAAGNTVSITGNSSADDLAFTYGGAISDDGNLLVNISGQTGGTKDFNGLLTDGTGAGGGSR